MLQHILVGLDGSPLAETILAYVSTLAKGLGADVTLLHVVHLSEDMQQEEVSRVLRPSLEQAKTDAHKYIHHVAQRLSEAGITTHIRVVMGEAATEIIRYAQQEHMDLIALATHGRSGLQRWFYGSVAEKVLHTARTPLLLIRPVTQQELSPRDLSAIVVPLDGSPLAEGNRTPGANATEPQAEEQSGARVRALGFCRLRPHRPPSDTLEHHDAVGVR